MRSYLLPAALVAMIAAAPMAFAATTTQGVIKAFDVKTQMLTLADGTSYQLPKTFKDPGLKAGEKVAVIWTMQGKVHDATSVTMIK